MKADREREPPPLAPIEALQRPIQILRAGQRVELLDARQQPRAAAHGPGHLDGQEAAGADQLDEQEPEHRADEPRVDGQRHGGHHADEQEERLRKRDRGLGDDHRRDALLIGDVRPQEPYLDRVPSDRGHGGHHVHGLTGDSRRHQAEKRDAIVGEGVAPSQRVDGHDQRERQADQQRPPAEGARGGAEGLIAANPHDEDDHERETGDGGERTNDAHVSRR